MSIIYQNNGAKRVCFQDANANGLSTAFQDTDLVFPVEEGLRYTFQGVIPFRLLGASSGYKFQLVESDGLAVGTVISGSLEVYNGVTNSLVNVKADQNAPVSVNGALASVGLHLLKVSGIIFMGTGGPGTLKLQFAQNVADAVNPIRILQRSYFQMESMG
jgi:hypothetical protein